MQIVCLEVRLAHNSDCVQHAVPFTLPEKLSLDSSSITSILYIMKKTNLDLLEDIIEIILTDMWRDRMAACLRMLWRPLSLRTLMGKKSSS